MAAADPSPTATYPSTYRIVLRDYVTTLAIGVHDHEHGRHQRVRINIELTVRHPGPGFRDDIAAVLSYEDLVAGLERLPETPHIKLLETLAERLLDLCLVDARVLKAQVQLEKLDIFAEAESVGVILERGRAPEAAGG